MTPSNICQKKQVLIDGKKKEKKKKRERNLIYREFNPRTRHSGPQETCGCLKDLGSLWQDPGERGVGKVEI